MIVRRILLISSYAVVLCSSPTLFASATDQESCADNAGNGECANPDAVRSDDISSKRDDKIDPNCPDRDHLMRCASIYLDTNKNGKLDRDELQGGINKLPWFSRGIIKILGSVDKMMAKCDVDGDDAISIDYDMQNNKETCLATCFKKKAFKGAFFPDCDL